MSDCANGGRWPRWGKAPVVEYEPYRLKLRFDRGTDIEATFGRWTEDGLRTLRAIEVDGELWGPIPPRDYDVEEA